MKVTYLELFQKRNALNQVNGITNKLSYAKIKNLSRIEAEIKIIREAHPIFTQYNQFETEQQNLFTSYKEDNNIEKFNKAITELNEKYKETIAVMDELMREEVEVNFYSIPIAMLPDEAVAKDMREYIIRMLDGILVD